MHIMGIRTISRKSFGEQEELVYLSKFSGKRHKFFFIVERIYKKFINSKDGRLKSVLEIINRINPKSILEIGSGTFLIYNFLPVTIKNKCQYSICEVNPDKVKYIADTCKEVKVFCADALKLPFENDSFDLVFSKGVLHHIDHNEKKIRKKRRIEYLTESKRVLKKNGVGFVMDVDYQPAKFSNLFWHVLHKKILFEGEHNFSNREELEDFFRISGYRDISSKEFDTFKGVYYYVEGKK